MFPRRGGPDVQPARVGRTIPVQQVFRDHRLDPRAAGREHFLQRWVRLDSIKATALTVVLLLATSTSRAAAQVTISLPDRGEYRVGQFMPVELRAEGDARKSTITLSAPGALPTTVAMNGRESVTAPLLMLSRDAGRLSWASASPARELDV